MELAKYYIQSTLHSLSDTCFKESGVIRIVEKLFKPQ